MNTLINLMSVTVTGDWATVIYVTKIVMLVLMALCALFIIIVVLFQPGSSTGIGALGGTTETFLSKNKGKTTDSKMKKYTMISGIIMGVLCIAFFVLVTLFKAV
jgi:preprotein translocase subunit SecG